MKKIILFSFFLFLFMQSCINKETSDDAFKDVSIVIDMDSVKRVLSINFKDVRYVPLETSDECLIGYASKVLIWNNRIYVADFHNAMTLFIFDMNGKFLFKIAGRGQGPEEYLSFNDFDIQRNGDIYIFDLNSKKFLIYNSIGKYLHTINTDYYFSNGFCLVNEKMYWSRLYDYGKTFANLAVYDMAEKKTEFVLKDEKFLREIMWNSSNYNFYYSPENIVYYSPQFSNIIFSIDNDGIHPAIGIKNLKIPSKEVIDNWLLEKNLTKQIELITSSGYFRENVYVYETDKYIMFICIQRGNEMMIYDKRSAKTYSVFSSFYVSLGPSEAKGSTGKEFLGIVYFNSENEHHKEILKSREELKNWKEDDNPVIVFFNPDL